MEPTPSIESIKTPETREELYELAVLVNKELEKLHELFGQVFARCEVAVQLEKHNTR